MAAEAKWKIYYVEVEAVAKKTPNQLLCMECTVVGWKSHSGKERQENIGSVKNLNLRRIRNVEWMEMKTIKYNQGKEKIVSDKQGRKLSWTYTERERDY